MTPEQASKVLGIPKQNFKDLKPIHETDFCRTYSVVLLKHFTNFGRAGTEVWFPVPKDMK